MILDEERNECFFCSPLCVGEPLSSFPLGNGSSHVG